MTKGYSAFSGKGNGKVPAGSSARRESIRKKKAIRAGLEAKRRELGLGGEPVGLKRGPAFYLIVMVVLVSVGLAVIKASDDRGVSGRVLTGKILQASRSLDAFAEALGRYRFHCGAYPDAESGLQALVDKFSQHEGWMGPYIHAMRNDPWKHPYVYEPPSGTNATPVLLSIGPDGVRGTADDIAPDADLFEKPFRDTTWTNDWAPYWKRGIIVVPSRRAAGAPSPDTRKETSR